VASPLRKAWVISRAQLRRYIEQGFAPLACAFSTGSDSTFTLRIYEPQSGRVDLVVTGIDPRLLETEADVLAMIEELRYELRSNSISLVHLS
jgi:tRNA(Ile)-lysidine synthase TilS/MesJ